MKIIYILSAAINLIAGIVILASGQFPIYLLATLGLGLIHLFIFTKTKKEYLWPYFSNKFFDSTFSFSLCIFTTT